MIRNHHASNSRAVLPTIYLDHGHAVTIDASGTQVRLSKTPIAIAHEMKYAGQLMVLLCNASGWKESEEIIKEMCKLCGTVVVGLGIVTEEEQLETAFSLLDQGVSRVILDLRSEKRLVEALPKERVCLELFVNTKGTPLVEGGTELPNTLEEAIVKASETAGNLLVTMVDERGTMQMNRELAKRVIGAVPKGIRLIIAGGIATREDIKYLDCFGVESSICTALQNGSLHLGDAIIAAMISDRADGLVTTVIVDESLVTLGVCYSNTESVREACKRGCGVYWSRSRASLWIKGETSGDIQELIRIDMDCDRDAFRFVVRQKGYGFCHVQRRSCFGEDKDTIGSLMRTLMSRKEDAPAGSYTRRLFDDPKLLESKLHEEASELLEATEPEDVAWETADVIYFALTACARHGVSLEQVEAALGRRSLRVRRRPGNAKPPKPEGST